MQTFAATFGYAAQSFVTQDETPEACTAVLREAAESGAELVVCRGDAMAGALFELQRSYPTVSYLLLEGEPHSEDYASYETTINTHCVLFAVEQAGYLAGYAAVREGYTALGFVGADSMPETVRYCTGMMQGAEAAAEREGQQVRLEVWLVGSGAADDAVTARMSSWYADGVQLIVPAGGRLVESCVAAAQASGGRVLNAGWDAAALDPSVLSSTLLNYSVVTQRKLYDFFTVDNWGDQASRTERLDRFRRGHQPAADRLALQPLHAGGLYRTVHGPVRRHAAGRALLRPCHAARDPERCGQRRELTRCAARGKQFVKSQCFDTARRTV